MSVEIDVQGHRGCRGLMPENSIPAFIKACQLGVNTLEMDVVLTRDGEVIVSHESTFNPLITTPKTKASGRNVKSLNIFQMDFLEVEDFDVGLKQHPKFPKQLSVACSKPRLADVIRTCRDYPVRFNIEIKRTPQGDGIFHPGPQEFVEKVIKVLESQHVMDRVVLQSFDIETLQIIRKNNASIQLGLLCEDKWATFDDMVSALGFLPDIYSPHYKKVSVPLINYCHKLGVKIVPWTVNQTFDMRKFIQWRVDGIITDYPNRLLEILNQQTKTF